jgi:hypothetical protein
VLQGAGGTAFRIGQRPRRAAIERVRPWRGTAPADSEDSCGESGADRDEDDAAERFTALPGAGADASAQFQAGNRISVYPQGNVFTPAIQLNGFTGSAASAYVLLNGVKVFAGSSKPSGSCTAPSWYLASSAMYHCVSGSWAQYG